MLPGLAPLMIYDLNFFFMNNVLTIGKIVICLSIRLLLLLLESLGFKEMPKGTITTKGAIIVLRVCVAATTTKTTMKPPPSKHCNSDECF